MPENEIHAYIGWNWRKSMCGDYTRRLVEGLRGVQLSGSADNWLNSRGFRSIVRVRAIMFI